MNIDYGLYVEKLTNIVPLWTAWVILFVYACLWFHKNQRLSCLTILSMTFTKFSTVIELFTDLLTESCYNMKDVNFVNSAHSLSIALLFIVLQQNMKWILPDRIRILNWVERVGLVVCLMLLLPKRNSVLILLCIYFSILFVWDIIHSFEIRRINRQYHNIPKQIVLTFH